MQKIYEKGATPLVGLATETVWHFLRIPGGSGPQVYWAHMGGFIPNSRNRVGGGHHEVGGGCHIKTLALGGKYSLEEWINTFEQKIYEKGATPLVGPATETV